MGHKGHKRGEKIFSIDVYAYNSKINHWNPVVKMVLAIIMLFLCIALNNIYVSAVIVGLCLFITVGLGKIPLREYIIMLGIPLAFLIVGSMIIAINMDSVEQGLFGIWSPWGYIYVSTEGLVTVTNLWGKALGGVSAMFMLSLSTPSSEIFSVLRYCKVPSLIIELMNMIYRFVFVMIDTFMCMKNSAEARLGYVDYKTAVQTFGYITSNLLVVSLKKGSTYFDAMESRCYDGEFLFLENEKEVTTEQIICIISSILLILTTWLLAK